MGALRIGRVLPTMTRLGLHRRPDLNLVLVILLSLFAFAPLTRPGFFESHSGFLPVFNLYDLEENLWGNWGWLPEVATGSGLITGEGPLPYLLAESLRWLGLSGPEAIKAVHLLGVVMSGWGMYALGKWLFGAEGGLVAAVVYVYLPFHLAAIYVRGALAEAWLFALCPVALLCWFGYATKSSALWAAGAILVHCALASTNFGLSLIFALLVVPFILVIGTSRRNRTRALLLLGSAVFVAGVLELPALLRHGLSGAGQVGFAGHFVYPFQLLSARWGYGASVPGWEDSMPFQLGLAATALSLVAILLLRGAPEVKPLLKRAIVVLSVASALIVLLVTHAAAPFWSTTRLSVLLLYPWQLLGFAGLSMSLLAGAVLPLAPRLASLSWKAVLITLVILGSYGYLSPRFTDVEVANSPLGIFGDQILLLRHEQEGPLRHGATVHLTLFWQSLAPLSTDYTVFVHVVDSDGSIGAQCDAMPMDGERPTSTWTPGEIIEDECLLTIDVAGPPEGYTMQVGLYDQDSGRRLPVAGGGTSVLLPSGARGG